MESPAQTFPNDSRIRCRCLKLKTQPAKNRDRQRVNFNSDTTTIVFPTDSWTSYSPPFFLFAQEIRSASWLSRRDTPNCQTRGFVGTFTYVRVGTLLNYQGQLKLSRLRRLLGRNHCLSQDEPKSH
ncbi:hypothetical protein PROFUN_04083 [Planoprotostelium fungivorum]|uniref:Uncharacterized protein n=1 Tax=Planoprotostelium fungivorum TaxID=1890364 RepID=A0A2P6NJI3_9EUKA|nr:hypothetical protein PROFUN_04083 [Planoprotostelium fungivorum]